MHFEYLKRNHVGRLKVGKKKAVLQTVLLHQLKICLDKKHRRWNAMLEDVRAMHKYEQCICKITNCKYSHTFLPLYDGHRYLRVCQTSFCDVGECLPQPTDHGNCFLPGGLSRRKQQTIYWHHDGWSFFLSLCPQLLCPGTTCICLHSYVLSPYSSSATVPVMLDLLTENPIFSK